MEVVLGREKDSSGDELTTPLLEATVDEAEKLSREDDPRADSGNWSDDEHNWEEIQDASDVAEVVPQEEETIASVEKKLQSILRAEPQVFTVNESKRKNKSKKRGSFRQDDLKSVVFHLPEGAVVPERVSCKPGQGPFPSRARKTLLVLRKKITGEKQEIPWRASAHCSPTLLQQRAKKLPKDYYLKQQKEMFVRSLDISDDEDDEDEENQETPTVESDASMSAAMHPDVVIDAYRSLEAGVEHESKSNEGKNQETAILTVKDDNLDSANVNENDIDEDLKPSRRQSLRMQLSALQLHYQMNPKMLKKAPTYRTGGHGLGHSNPKIALTRSTKLEPVRKTSKENQVTQEGTPVKKLSNDESDLLKSPNASRKISPGNQSLKLARSRNDSRDNLVQGTKPSRKISRDNTAPGGEDQPVRKISRDNTVPGVQVQPARKISRDNSVPGVKVLPGREISRENAMPGVKGSSIRAVSRDRATHHGIVIKSHKMSKDLHIGTKTQCAPEPPCYANGCSGHEEYQSRKLKSSKMHPFRYLNTKLAFKFAQHFSGSESEGERSRSSSRHNSESMSEDTIDAILSKDIPPPPRAPNTGGPGKVVRTRYRKISREEAKPYIKDGAAGLFLDT